MTKFFYTLLLISLCNCTDQAGKDVVFTLFNQTDKTVKILGFYTQLDVNTNGKAKPIIINPFSELKTTRVTGLDNNTLMGFYSLKSGVDSVRVIFENHKVKIYSENISPVSEFSIFRGDNNRNHYITENDYKTAVNCNDDCE